MKRPNQYSQFYSRIGYSLLMLNALVFILLVVRIVVAMGQLREVFADSPISGFSDVLIDEVGLSIMLVLCFGMGIWWLMLAMLCWAYASAVRRRSASTDVLNLLVLMGCTLLSLYGVHPFILYW